MTDTEKQIEYHRAEIARIERARDGLPAGVDELAAALRDAWYDDDGSRHAWGRVGEYDRNEWRRVASRAIELLGEQAPDARTERIQLATAALRDAFPMRADCANLEDAIREPGWRERMYADDMATFMRHRRQLSATQIWRLVNSGRVHLTLTPKGGDAFRRQNRKADE